MSRTKKIIFKWSKMQDNHNHVYESIGKIVVSFQRLEAAVEHLIFSCMTSTHTQVRIMMSEMSFKTKVHTMSSIIKDLHPNDEPLFNGKTIYEYLDYIIKGCNQSEGKRNQIVHSNWILGFKSAPDLQLRTKESAKSKKGYNRSVETIEHGFLDDDIKFIDNLYHQVYDFSQTLSIQFDRTHGVLGLENLVDHNDIVKFINNTLISKYKTPDQ